MGSKPEPLISIDPSPVDWCSLASGWWDTTFKTLSRYSCVQVPWNSTHFPKTVPPWEACLWEVFMVWLVLSRPPHFKPGVLLSRDAPRPTHTSSSLSAWEADCFKHLRLCILPAGEYLLQVGVKLAILGNQGLWLWGSRHIMLNKVWWITVVAPWPRPSWSEARFYSDSQSALGKLNPSYLQWTFHSLPVFPPLFPGHFSHCIMGSCSKTWKSACRALFGEEIRFFLWPLSRCVFCLFRLLRGFSLSTLTFRKAWSLFHDIMIEMQDKIDHVPL